MPEQEMSDSINISEYRENPDVTECKVQLMCIRDLWRWHKKNGDWINSPLAPEWAWKRDDGEWVSPRFKTAEAARYFAGKIPFFTDSEWKEWAPLPGEDLSLQAEPEIRGISPTLK